MSTLRTRQLRELRDVAVARARGCTETLKRGGAGVGVLASLRGTRGVSGCPTTVGPSNPPLSNLSKDITRL